MKEKILVLLKEMRNDSKSASYKAEKELCSILTGVINKLHTIEKKVGSYIRDYPEKIESIAEFWTYKKLPKEIECNGGDFWFKTEWLDINFQEYFEELKKNKIRGIKNYITQAEHSLSKYKEDLEHAKKTKI